MNTQKEKTAVGAATPATENRNKSTGKSIPETAEESR